MTYADGTVDDGTWENDELVLRARSYSNDLTGVILQCYMEWHDETPPLPKDWHHINVEFISSSKAKVFQLYNFEMSIETERYKVSTTEISIGRSYSPIDRRTLKMDQFYEKSNLQCEIMDENFDIVENVENILQTAHDIQDGINQL